MFQLITKSQWIIEHAISIIGEYFAHCQIEPFECVNNLGYLSLTQSISYIRPMASLNMFSDSWSSHHRSPATEKRVKTCHSWLPILNFHISFEVMQRKVGLSYEMPLNGERFLLPVVGGTPGRDESGKKRRMNKINRQVPNMSISMYKCWSSSNATYK